MYNIIIVITITKTNAKEKKKTAKIKQRSVTQELGSLFSMNQTQGSKKKSNTGFRD